MKRKPGSMERSLRGDPDARPAGSGLPVVWTEPQGPDLAPLLRIHRAHDGFITFHRKAADGSWHDLVAIRADELAAMFPQFAEALTRDSYFSVNAFYRAGHGAEILPGLPPPCRKGGAVRWITAAFADLDLYRNPALTVGATIGALIDAQDAGTIPPASMLTRSGRGLWCFWILRNDDPRYSLDGPVRAWPETVRGWRLIQAELGRRLAALEADAASRDVARVSRVPGSLNTAADLRVSYWIQAGADGRGFVYTLDGLAGRLGLALPRYHGAVREALSPPSDAARARGVAGYAARWRFAYRQFETLRAMRGGFREGQRNSAVWLLASLLRTAPRSIRLPERDQLEAVLELALECRDASGARPAPYPRAEARAAYDAAAGGWMRIRAQTVADRLDITPGEAACLETWPPASRFRGLPAIDAGESLRQQRQEARRAFLRDYLDHARQKGLRASLRALARELELVGLGASPETVRADLRALGLAPEKRRPQGNLF